VKFPKLSWHSRNEAKASGFAPGLYLFLRGRHIRILPVPKRLPHLYLCLDLGFCGAQTALWRQRFEDCTFEYVRLGVWCGKRWRAEFNLYAPHR